MFARPTFEELVAYAAGKTTPQDAARIEQQFAKHAADAQTVKCLRAVLAAGRAGALADPPEATLAAARALYAERRVAKASPSVWAELLETARRMIAELVFDSRPQAALAGIRGAGGAYQLAYRCELAEIDVEIEKAAAGASWRLMGQISPTGSAQPRCVMLVERGGSIPLTSVDPDEHGVFSLEAAQGAFDLLVILDNSVLVVPGIDMQ
ncbi:MAG: hypothetical protein CHACPFDD_00474 [Phycisphaerae bacterium]|nr:hypothetical protein [Phycisphaerae bacterium]